MSDYRMTEKELVMRKSISVFVLLIMLLTMALPAYAMVPMEEVLPLGSTCKHLIHIRQGANTVQYVYENEAVHLKQEVFRAVCKDCGKDPQTIIDSEVVETHTWELEFSDCNHATGLHKYIYKCACKTKEFTIRCTGIHEVSMQNVEIPDVDE